MYKKLNKYRELLKEKEELEKKINEINEKMHLLEDGAHLERIDEIAEYEESDCIELN